MMHHSYSTPLRSRPRTISHQTLRRQSTLRRKARRTIQETDHGTRGVITLSRDECSYIDVNRTGARNAGGLRKVHVIALTYSQRGLIPLQSFAQPDNTAIVAGQLGRTP